MVQLLKVDVGEDVDKGDQGRQIRFAGPADPFPVENVLGGYQPEEHRYPMKTCASTIIYLLIPCWQYQIFLDNVVLWDTGLLWETVSFTIKFLRTLEESAWGGINVLPVILPPSVRFDECVRFSFNII